MNRKRLILLIAGAAMLAGMSSWYGCRWVSRRQVENLISDEKTGFLKFDSEGRLWVDFDVRASSEARILEALQILENDGGLVGMTISGDLSDPVIEKIVRFEQLAALTVQDARFSDRGAELMLRMELLNLNMSYCDLSDESLAVLNENSTFRRLSFGSDRITDRGAASIAKCKDLDLLWLNDAKIGTDGAIALSRLKSLEELRLNNTGCTDEMLQHIASLSELETLEVFESKITPAGVAYLLRLPKLRYLGMDSHLWEKARRQEYW